MKNNIKEAIRRTAHLIDDGNFDEFYNHITSYASSYHDICDVTVFLMDTCEIDPLSYLTYVPRGYLFNYQSISRVVIPEGITVVRMAAYLGSSIHRLNLPKSCEEVGAQAFSGCSKLTDLRIENPDITIDSSAFTQTHGIGWIMYNGTLEQFTSKTWPDEMIEDSHVVCLDGIIHMVKGVAKK